MCALFLPWGGEEQGGFQKANSLELEQAMIPYTLALNTMDLFRWDAVRHVNMQCNRDVITTVDGGKIK